MNYSNLGPPGGAQFHPSTVGVSSQPGGAVDVEALVAAGV